MTDVTQWLDKLGLGQYARAFIDNAIDYSLLVELTDTDLEKLGVQQLGHRKHLLKAIGDLRDGAAPTAPATPSRNQPELDGAAERRQLTVMFCDMVGSTELLWAGADSHGSSPNLVFISATEVGRAR